jgi:hypothetical protein
LNCSIVKFEDYVRKKRFFTAWRSHTSGLGLNCYFRICQIFQIQNQFQLSLMPKLFVACVTDGFYSYTFCNSIM